MSGKHSINKEKKEKTKKKSKSKLKTIVVFLLLILLVLVWHKYCYDKPHEDTNKKSFKNSEQAKEQLVLKSNYEENREKIITYKFENNKVNTITVQEKYDNKDVYAEQKENYSKRTDITIKTIDDESLEICYEKTDFKSDEGLSYEEIYKKYMGIIGAYEVI